MKIIVVNISCSICQSCTDRKKLQFGNLQVEVAPYPVVTVSLLEAKVDSLDLRVDVIENGNAIRGRGIKYMPASEPGDPAELGTKKSVSYPPEREYWEQSLTGLDPDTEYKMKPYNVNITLTSSLKSHVYSGKYVEMPIHIHIK